MKDGDPLRICAEAYAWLPVDRAAFKGRIPDVKNMLPMDDFGFYLRRKLYIHNLGHAICAYLGMLCGIEYIDEAISRADIRYIVQNAMTESARALSSEYSKPLEPLLDHIDDLIMRFSNKALLLTCEKVGRDTERKLAQCDRLAGALKLCANSGRGGTPPYAFIAAGTAVAVAVHLRSAGKELSVAGAEDVLCWVSGFSPEAPDEAEIISTVLELYKLVREDNDMVGAITWKALRMLTRKAVV
jgi:mannitol-1-phosphate 5-dehydrogenase